METFLENGSQAVLTSFGYFWMAFWAFVLGYEINSCIQVFVNRFVDRTSGANKQGRNKSCNRDQMEKSPSSRII